MDYMWAHAYKTFYRLHDMATDWHEARQMCEAEGTTLLIPYTLDEMENLKLLMSNMKAHYTAIFVGIHDKFSAGNYVTVKGETSNIFSYNTCYLKIYNNLFLILGEPITGTILEFLWAEGRPDNVNGSEHCIVMTREGLFDDRPCTDIYPFVCKILANETMYNDKCDNFDIGKHYLMNSHNIFILLFLWFLFDFSFYMFC